MKYLKRLKTARYTPASLALILMNLIPLIGVWYFNWDVGIIIFLYWLENVVIGILNVPKILSCRGSKKPGARKESLGGLIFLSGFFSVHYGMFCFGHYTFIQTFFEGLPEFSNIPSRLFEGFLIWPLLGLLFSHFISMIVNFYGKGEYRSRSANTQMFMPYTRIMILHIVIIFGGFLAQAFDNALGPLIILIIVKTIIDLGAHQVEHSDKDSLINPKLAGER